MKVTTKTFIDFQGKSFRLGDFRQAMLDYGDDTVLKVNWVPAGDGLYEYIRLEIT